MKKAFRIISKKLIFSALIFFAFFGVSEAANITVNGTDGTDADDGVCSIVEAIQNANADDQSGSVDCVAGSGTDTIVIANNISIGTAFNNGGDTTTLTPFITDSLIIEGGDYSFTNTGSLRFFYSISNIDLTIENFSLINGRSNTNGGAIYVEGLNSVILESLTLNGNTAGNRGAGVYVKDISDMTVSDSYFTENVVDNGITSNGGVFYLDNSNLTVTNSYFYFNRPSTTNGGVFYLDNGSTLTVTRSTFDNNIAGNGGVFYLNQGVDLIVYNSSFDNNSSIDNGGLIYSYQDVLGDVNEIDFYYNTEDTSFAGENGGSTFYNCIDAGEGCYANGGDGGETPFSGNYYIFENNILDGGCDGNIQNASFLNNLVKRNIGEKCSNDGSDVSVATNVSLTLSDNGGLWNTFALSSGSNAIDAGVSGTLGCSFVDGRGANRYFGSACDIGAFEYADPGITITESGGSTDVTEDGATDTFTIYVNSYPSNDVTVSLAGDSNELTFSSTSFSFLTSNWPQTQIVTVGAFNNGGYQGGIYTSPISISTSSSDADYNNLIISDIVANITDNDNAPVISTGSSGGGGPSNPPPPTPVLGCTDSGALNYNPSATQDNGSCNYPPVEVLDCTDTNATNYNPSATEDDGSCVYPPTPVLGCTDSGALNYNPSATQDNGSCNYLEDEEEPVPLPEDLDPVDDDTEPAPENTPNEDNNPPSELRGGEVLSEITENIKNIAQELPKGTVDTVSVVGVTLPAVAFIVSQPAIATNIVSIPLRLWNLIPMLLGFKRRKRPWGTVYDSVTKQPLDPVYVSLIDQNGKEVATTITDLDGRFGFLVPPGKYKIVARKDNYNFPSKKMEGKDRDELYENLYYSEEVEISGEESLVIRNIPMDSVSFNWNEFEKAKNKKLMKFYSKRDLFLARIAGIAFYGGLISSVILLIAGPSTLNIVLISIYALVLLLRLFGVKPKKPGYVVEEKTGYPLSYGLVRIFSAALNKEISHAVIGKTGKYYSLVPNGEYYLKISKKTGEDSYEEVLKTEPFKVKKGFIGKTIKV